MSSVLSYWPALVAVAVPLMQAAAAAHVVLRRRDVRASAGWMGLIWLAPVVGVVLYSLFGVNRIKRRARSLRRARAGYGQQIPCPESSPPDLSRHLGARWRRLQLNFEFNVEAYDPGLAVQLAEFFDARRAAAREVTLEDVHGRPLSVKLRDGVARLLSPYL